MLNCSKGRPVSICLVARLYDADRIADLIVQHMDHIKSLTFDPTPDPSNREASPDQHALPFRAYNSHAPLLEAVTFDLGVNLDDPNLFGRHAPKLRNVVLGGVALRGVALNPALSNITHLTVWWCIRMDGLANLFAHAPCIEDIFIQHHSEDDHPSSHDCVCGDEGSEGPIRPPRSLKTLRSDQRVSAAWIASFINLSTIRTVATRMDKGPTPLDRDINAGLAIPGNATELQLRFNEMDDDDEYFVQVLVVDTQRFQRSLSVSELASCTEHPYGTFNPLWEPWLLRTLDSGTWFIHTLTLHYAFTPWFTVLSRDYTFWSLAVLRIETSVAKYLPPFSHFAKEITNRLCCPHLRKIGLIHTSWSGPIERKDKLPLQDVKALFSGLLGLNNLDDLEKLEIEGMALVSDS